MSNDHVLVGVRSVRGRITQRLEAVTAIAAAKGKETTDEDKIGVKRINPDNIVILALPSE